MTAEARSNAPLTRGSASLLLEVEDLRTWFTTPAGTVRSVDGVSFRLERGQSLGIVGESGSGKSILLRSIMDLLPSHAERPSGVVRFEGRDLRTTARRQLRQLWGREMSIVFQDPMSALTPTTRIGDLLVEVLRMHVGLSRDAARANAVELLELVGIPDARRNMRSFPHQLSGGMRQRVCIALAVACQPKLLLADEPTTALDVTVQRQILDLLTRLQRDTGMAMILVTHDLGVVAGRTDLVAVMYAGRLVELGCTPEVLHDPRHRYTAALLASTPRLDDSPGKRLAAIPGSASSAVDPPAACRFAARCASAQPDCTTKDPPLEEEGTRSFACFFPVRQSQHHCGAEIGAAR